MKKFSKEWLEAKKAGREAIDAADAARTNPAALNDSTVGHEDGPEGTWNTSGVEVPADRSAVRDVRPETSDAVSLEGLKEQGVPVRTEADHGDNMLAGNELPAEDAAVAGDKKPAAPRKAAKAKTDSGKKDKAA